MKTPKIAITYNIKRLTKDTGLKTNDTEAEFDSPNTISAISGALETLGYQAIALEANSDLAHKLKKERVDLVFNIAEGRGINREAQVPALLELMNIAYTGSDSKAMTLTLDKRLANKIVAEAGVLTPMSFSIHAIEQISHRNYNYPLLVKPLAEGSSKGIMSQSVVHDFDQLYKVVQQNIRRYKQPALVEKYIGGREFTVGILEDSGLEVLPPMEIVFLKNNIFPVYSYASKIDWQDFLYYDTQPILTKAQALKIENYAKKAFRALGCRDVARMDFRMDNSGRLYFLECNALPGLSPEWSDLCVIARAAGISHQELIKRIISPALRRFYK